MGATYMAETAAGAAADEALAALAAKLRAVWEGWPDLEEKCSRGNVQVRDEPAVASDEVTGWMRAWCEQQMPPARFSDEDGGKFGPWLCFPLTNGTWHFFGWVNTRCASGSGPADWTCPCGGASPDASSRAAAGP